MKLMYLSKNKGLISRFQSMVFKINRDVVLDVYEEVEEAVAALVKTRYDLFLVDLILDEGNRYLEEQGLRLIKILRMSDHYRYTKIIALSRYWDADETVNLNLHIDTRIYVPFLEEQVENTLRYYINQYYDALLKQENVVSGCFSMIVGSTIQNIVFRNLKWVETARKRYIFHENDGSILEVDPRSCEGLQEALLDHEFLKISRRDYVNRNYIDYIKNGIMKLRSGGEEIPLTDYGRKVLKGLIV